MNRLARPRAILQWLARAARRNRQSFTSFAGNNLNYTAVVLLFMLDPAAAGGLLALMGLIVVLPLSSDPLRAIPRSRLAVWPLENRERRILRIVSPWLNPITWVVLAFALWKRASFGLIALVAGVFAAGFVTSSVASGGSVHPWRFMPRLPGPLNQLIRKNLREMLSTLDFCCGALISVAALLWRMAGLLPDAAFFPLTAIAMLSISTCALTLFGLDGAAGIKRYRLLPLPGWKILIAKDAAYLTIALMIAAPLSLPGGLGAALVALATGHRTSVETIRPQARWRFQTGPSLGDALAQILPMTMAGAAIVYTSPLLLLVCVAVWAGSTWWYGRELDRAWR